MRRYPRRRKENTLGNGERFRERERERDQLNRRKTGGWERRYIYSHPQTDLFRSI